MKVYTYSEARQRLADVLNIARTEEVVIKRRGGETFSIIFRKSPGNLRDAPQNISFDRYIRESYHLRGVPEVLEVPPEVPYEML